MNRLIERFWPPVNGTTYADHGTDGAESAVDYVVSRGWGIPVGRVGRSRGWAIANWAVKYRKGLGTKYVIFEDLINWLPDGQGWRYYDWTKWQGGDPNPVIKRHLDHVHITCWRKENIRGIHHPKR
jgi:hypothetical protein